MRTSGAVSARKQKPTLRKTAALAETGHDRIREVDIDCIVPSTCMNQQVYRPVSPDDPEIQSLAASIRSKGLLEPIVVTTDWYIVSGHRRHAACRLAGLRRIPIRVIDLHSDDEDFLDKLREFNRQRKKSLAEEVREEVIDALAKPAEAYSKLCEVRRLKSEVDVDLGAIELGDRKSRSKISPAKMPMIEAIRKVIRDLKRFLPTTNRTIHYRLLNAPPLRHASKPKSRYANNLQSYKDLTDLLLRARLDGLIPIDAIDDETRPVTHWAVHPDPSSFVREHLADLFDGYHRNMQTSQANHIEIFVEKNTAAPIVKRVAGRYSIPVVSGRGYCSLPPRRDLAERFKKSGKAKLVVIFVTDFDPEGESICESFARSMRDELGVGDIVPIKAALTAEQVEQYELPPGARAKPGSSRYKQFVERHGEHVYELEALDPHDLEKIIEDAIEGVIDIEAFKAEQDAEERDAAKLEALRRTALKAVGNIAADLDDMEGV